LFRIELFGEFRVVQDDRVVTRFRTRKAAYLLAYLALHLAQSHPREKLADLFWPHLGLDAGLDNLSTCLSALRRSLETANVSSGTLLWADRTFVRLNAAVVTTDAGEFDHLLQTALKTEDPARQASLLECAVGLYRSDLLPHCYDDWAMTEQARYRERHADALERWGTALERLGEGEAALDAARRAELADPYREGACRLKIRLYAAQGRGAAALDAFEAFRDRLKSDLGIAPSRETTDLAEQLRSGTAPTVLGSAAETREEADTLPSVEDSPPPTTPLPPTALPVPLTRFYGREKELNAIETHLSPASAGEELDGGPGAAVRLVTVAGPGGSGKTRLAIEAGYRLSEVFESRLWHVPLEETTDPRRIAPSIARVLEIAPSAMVDPVEQIANVLASRPALLILDNFEQLLREDSSGNGVSSVRLIRILLERLPHLRCLITSQQSLCLGGEREIHLHPFPIPEETDSPDRLLRFDCVALYSDRARSVKPDFELDPNNAAWIVRLCRKLDGIPLAIEMAAAWARVLPPHAMLERLERRIVALEGRRSDMPARQQSLRAAIEWSVGLLSPDLQRFFVQLSVFRGGWTLEAAEAVCDERALDYLAQLQERSLILVDETSGFARYRFLESLREYSAEKLAEQTENEEVYPKHAQYFMGFAETGEEKLSGPERASWLDRLERDHDNLRAALSWSLEKGPPGLSIRLAGRLRRFWELHGHLREGRRWLEAALERSSTRDLDRVRALSAAGNLAREQGDYEIAETRYTECLELSRELNDRWGVAESLQHLGLLARSRGLFETAQGFHEESLALMRELGHSQGIANNLFCLGGLAQLQGRPADARRYWTECAEIDRRNGIKGGSVLWGFAGLAYDEGDDEQALRIWKQSLLEHQEIGDLKGTAAIFEGMMKIAARRSHYERAWVLWGVANALREAVGSSLSPTNLKGYRADLQPAQEALGEHESNRAYEQGRAMKSEDAIRFALEESDDFIVSASWMNGS
jgi:predicted ATPase/DNA-binding SARP family transcriptional activator